MSLDRTERMYYTSGDKVGSVRMAFSKRVNANNRLHAVEKCMPEIAKLIEGITDPTIKFVSVYAGTVSGVGKAERLVPIQIIVDTMKVRSGK